MKVLSFGCGVQTVTIAAMACLGDFEKPDFAVFADTQWESRATYEYLSMFALWAAEKGLRIIRATKGSIRKDALDSAHRKGHGVHGLQGEKATKAGFPWGTNGGPRGITLLLARRITLL